MQESANGGFCPSRCHLPDASSLSRPLHVKYCQLPAFRPASVLHSYRIVVYAPQFLLLQFSAVYYLLAWGKNFGIFPPAENVECVDDEVPKNYLHG